MEHSFVRYALIVGVLIALCSSLLGVTLVLKRFSFIGDGLSHTAFGAMAVAAVLNLTNDMPVSYTHLAFHLNLIIQQVFLFQLLSSAADVLQQLRWYISHLTGHTEHTWVPLYLQKQQLLQQAL